MCSTPPPPFQLRNQPPKDFRLSDILCVCVFVSSLIYVYKLQVILVLRSSPPDNLLCLSYLRDSITILCGDLILFPYIRFYIINVNKFVNLFRSNKNETYSIESNTKKTFTNY